MVDVAKSLKIDKPSQEEIDEVFKDLDKDNDDKLSGNEF
jgi:rRNA maturation endonuclease Nob1